MTIIKNLIKCSRYDEVIKVLYISLADLETAFIGDTLLNISNEILKENYGEYYVKEILKYLNENNYNTEKLIKLEFTFSECYRYEKPDYTLKIHEEILQNADLFCCLINNLYSENIELVYRCMDILDSMSLIPESDENEKIDMKRLKNWINECLKKLNEESKYNFYRYLAILFANTLENDVYWPKNEICQIIDEMNNSILNDEFKIAIINKQGVYAKGIFDGGNRERILANKYQNFAVNIISEYPITAKLLHDVSEIFENHAHFEDYKSINRNWEL